MPRGSNTSLASACCPRRAASVGLSATKCRRAPHLTQPKTSQPASPSPISHRTAGRSNQPSSVPFQSETADLEEWRTDRHPSRGARSGAAERGGGGGTFHHTRVFARLDHEPMRPPSTVFYHRNTHTHTLRVPCIGCARFMICMIVSCTQENNNSPTASNL